MSNEAWNKLAKNGNGANAACSVFSADTLSINGIASWTLGLIRTAVEQYSTPVWAARQAQCQTKNIIKSCSYI